MLKRVTTLIFVSIIFLLAISLDKPFLTFKYKGSAFVGDWLKKFNPHSDWQDRIRELEAENENLRLKIFQETIGVNQKIKVYSTYPFNDKREIAIAGGENKGIRIDDLVTLGNGILVGRVIQVFSDVAIVKTIFDPNWKMAVRVGEGEVDALFNGGNELTLTLIGKGALIKPGDLVITSSRDLTYGLEAGRIKTVAETPSNSFKNAVLEPAFSLGDLKDVKIRKISD